MKRRLTLILIALTAAMLLIFLSANTTKASALTEGDFEYEVKNGEATVTGLTNPSYSGELVIPETLGGYPVTSIGYHAFEDCSGITSVVFGNSVINIGEWAFYNCIGLIRVAISNSVTNICDWAFSGCPKLENIIVDENNKVYHCKDNCLIKTATKQLVAGCKNSLIPEDGSVTSIGNSAFSWCAELTTITIPDSVTSIGDYVFYNCAGLTNLSISNSVTRIGGFSFGGCVKLTNITIPDSVTSMGNYAFSGCTGITSIAIPSSVTRIGKDAFLNCTGLTSVIIPDSVTSIGDQVFSGCTGLTNITIPDSVTSIGDSAFSDCTGLTSITIPSSVTSIGSSAFQFCTGLTSITIPDSVTSIGDYAFSNTAWYNNQPDGLIYAGKVAYEYKGTCPSSVTIKDGTLGIAAGAFSFCKKLTSITIPSSVTSVGYSVFSGCTDLTSIKINKDNKEYHSNGNCLINTKTKDLISGCKNSTIPIDGSVTSIGNYAFSSCTGLTSITIPDSVTSIGYGAFSNCEGLTSITIPSSVTSIGNSAFSRCTGLTSITLPDSVTSIGNYAFYSCTGVTSITIPDSVTSIGYGAFYDTKWYNNQPNGLVYAGKVAYKYKGTCPSSVTIKDGTVGIADSAFSGCWGLTSIVIPDSVTSIGYLAFDNTAWYNNQPEGLVYAGKVAYKYKGTCPSNVTIKDGTVGIANYAFFGCTGLTSITIPNSVTSIGRYAFSECTGLKSITIPDSVTSIGEYAFRGCTGLTSITIPESVTSIGGLVFFDCDSLTIYGVSGSYAEQYAIENSIPFVALNKTRSGNATLYYTVAENAITVVSVKCDSGALAVIPAEIDGTPVTKLAEGAIGKNSGVVTVEIPDSVTEIAENAITVEYIAVRCSRGSAAYRFAENKAIRQLVLGETAYGDATGDGKVTAVDLVKMKKYLASQTSDGDAAFGLIQEADTNEDGIVDSLDIVRLKRYFAEYDITTGTSTVALGKTA